jgi:hypothetical protein
MSLRRVINWQVAVVALLSWALGGSSSSAEPSPLTPGTAVTLAGKRVVLTRLDALPYVENDYSKRYHFDAYDNPKLKALREQYHLDDVVAPGRDEFDRQLLLLDWVNHRLHKFGKPSSPARGALEILKATDEGNSFFCPHYGDFFL